MPNEHTPAPSDRLRYDTFLCHNRHEKPFVKLVADALQLETGLLFFLDEYSIPPSVEFFQFISAELHRSASCCIFLGKAGWGETHLKEARLALQVKAERPMFRIIPVQLTEVREGAWTELFDGETPPYNWITLSGPHDDEGLRQLVAAVHGDLRGSAAGPEVVTPYYVRRQAALWNRNRADRSLLLRGSLLRQAKALAANSPAFVQVNAVPAYLDRCDDVERGRLRTWIALVVGALIIVSVLSVALWFQRQQARHERESAIREADIALTRSLAAQAARVVGKERNDERAALLARQAFMRDEQLDHSSRHLVVAALSEVLATPFFSSTLRLGDGAVLDAISPSGQYFIIGGKHRQLVGPVVTASGRPARPERVSFEAVYARFLPEADDLLVVTAGNDLELRSLSTVTRRGAHIHHFDSAPREIAVSSDGARFVALLSASRLEVVDRAEPAHAFGWKHITAIERIAISADGKLVALTDSQTHQLRVYEIASKVLVAAFPADISVSSFDFVAASTALAVGDSRGSLWLWTPTAGEHARQRLDSGELLGSVDQLVVSPDATMVASASGAIAPGISLWNPTASPHRISVIPGIRTAVRLSFTRDGLFLISCDSRGEIRYWRLHGTGAQRGVVAHSVQPIDNGRLFAVSRDPHDDIFVVGGHHGLLQAWPNAELDGLPHILTSARSTALETVPDLKRFVDKQGSNFLVTGHVMAIAYAKRSSRFVTVDPYGIALIWDGHDLHLQPKVVTVPATKPALAVALSDSGSRLAVGMNSADTYLLELDGTNTSRQSVPLSNGGGSTVRAVVFLDEQHLVVGDDEGRLSLWALDHTPTRQLLIAEGPAIMAARPLGLDRLVVAREDEIDVLEPRGNASVEAISKGVGQAYSMAVSDDSGLLAVGYRDGTIRVWSTHHFELAPIALNVHEDVVRSIAFSRDGDILISVGDDGVIRRTVVGAARLAGLVCDLVWRELNTDEQQIFFDGLQPMLPTCPNR